MVAVLAVVLLARPGAGTGDLDLSDQPRLGEADAPVEIAVFLDFRCPSCARFGESVQPRIERELVEEGPAALYAVNFPILGPASYDAAAVAECAAQQGDEVYFGLEPILLRSQDRLDREGAALEVAREFAPGIGLDVAALERCVESGDGRAAAEVDAEAARGLNLSGTPSVLVNGDRIPSPTFEAIAEAVAAAANDAP